MVQVTAVVPMETETFGVYSQIGLVPPEAMRSFQN